MRPCMCVPFVRTVPTVCICKLIHTYIHHRVMSSCRRGSPQDISRLWLLVHAIDWFVSQQHSNHSNDAYIHTYMHM
jgi:hypothetical protein